MADGSLSPLAAVNTASAAIADAVREAFQPSARHDVDPSTAANVVDSEGVMASNATRKALISFLDKFDFEQSRRCYGVYARAVVTTRASDAAAAGRRTDVASAATAATAKRDVAWMRDPKTGCWAPENRVDEVDAVDLRNLLLNYK
uniref:Late embryogenesis abundant protein n=1 Tax=Oryza sativa subsp. japonica TaxID=39947 RepID=Q10K15_ORYSJ|nr:Late embryogenesis abundant protein [Oryza sativa Japonica Group]